MAKLQTRYQYSPSVEQIASVFPTEECLRRRLEAQGSEDIRLLSEGDRSARYTFKAVRELPDFLPKMIRSRMGKAAGLAVGYDINWTEVSENEFHYRYIATLDNLKVTVTSDLAFVGNDEGCECTITMDIDCKLPLVGSRLADFIAEDNRRIVDSEYQILVDFFSEKFS